MEPSIGSKLYQYSPLPKGDLAYRIFTLYPALDFSATIRGSMRTYSGGLAEAIQRMMNTNVEALSYAWADKKPTVSIEFLDNSCLPIAANLESFLRYRRQKDQPVDLWIDAICINQDDAQEKSSQVQAMGTIYAFVRRLSIWLGPPEEDSALGLKSLRSFTNDSVFSKLRTSEEESLAIERLLDREWWSRAWIVQEVALGGAGIKHDDITVWCGPEQIEWRILVLACARIHVNTRNMRQTFPSVRKVLQLDDLASRWRDEISGSGELYPSRLLRHLSKYRSCLASDPKDKIYAFLGLWLDSRSGVRSDFVGSPEEFIKRPVVNYDHSVERIYTDFAVWILRSTQSLQILSHCSSLDYSTIKTVSNLPTWVPDWSYPLSAALLPCGNTDDRPRIPWWSLPIQDKSGKNLVAKYTMADQASLRKRAEEILRPASPNLHYIPEWVADSLDPDGSLGVESLLKELQSREDVLFCFSDESDRALGDDSTDLQARISKTQLHNENLLQEKILSECLQDASVLQLRQFSASGSKPFYIKLEEGELHVNGIFCDTICGIYESFPDELDKEWRNSALLMIQIGKCKNAIINGSFPASPYTSEQARIEAFWHTIFAGQHAKDSTDPSSWLPVIPAGWQSIAPLATVLESTRLEYAELTELALASGFYSYSHEKRNSKEAMFRTSGFDENVTNDNGSLIDNRWSSSDRREYQRAFEELGTRWTEQPFDLYHRPFSLPYVVPDPFWESRRMHDKVALDKSSQARFGSIVQSLESVTRESRRNMRRFTMEKIREQPSREPHCSNDASLVRYALGRRFFVSKKRIFWSRAKQRQKGRSGRCPLWCKSAIHFKESWVKI